MTKSVVDKQPKPKPKAKPKPRASVDLFFYEKTTITTKNYQLFVPDSFGWISVPHSTAILGQWGIVCDTTGLSGTSSSTSETFPSRSQLQTLIDDDVWNKCMTVLGTTTDQLRIDIPANADVPDTIMMRDLWKPSDVTRTTSMPRDRWELWMIF